ncbi:aquaporin Z [Sinomonas atrocyanea]|uniref:aquaporin n=1 Tax=Sinomonas atrocyanea TaxID=37927 RepID=UPI002789319D|nr:aquaporin [Sinomonas atrocyanea]MDP9883675.1 aquaporin Z [Sinomonas atrocyanea]
MTTDVAAPTPVKAPAEFSVVAKLVAEAFGTFLLAYAGLGVALFSSPSSAPIPTPFAVGLSIAVGIAAVGHVSGGHFNPAVTLGLAVAGRTNWRLVPGYIASQLVGGLVGTLILWVTIRTLPSLSSGNSSQTIFTQLSNGFDDLSPSKFPMAAGLLAEVVATAAFVAVILFVTSKRAVKGMAPWAIGLGLAILVQAIAPITNASLNPARSTATAVFAQGNAFGQLWLFWVAPLLGAVLTGLIFRGFGSPDELHGATAGGVEDLTAEATRDDGTRVSETAVAVADAEQGRAAARPTEGGEASGAAAAPEEPGREEAGREEAGRAPERTAEDDAREFFDKDR